MSKILIIGAAGQIGSDLTSELRKKYGDENVFATDVKPPAETIDLGKNFQLLDVLDENGLKKAITSNNITQVYHLAAVLSGRAEQIPMKAWEVNMKGLMNLLELAREVKLEKIFWPSSIAVFGPTTPKHNTPQLTIMEPNTVYGISKLAGERWCEYYFRKFGVDVRSLRYPGLISYKTEAGGGTTDYAVDIFYKAVKEKKYECFLNEDTTLPMMFMPDAIRATIDLMEEDRKKLSINSSYNLSAMSFSPKELAQEIKKHIPEFQINYKPDFRQAIADSWPAVIDDMAARRDWGWKHNYGLKEMTNIMLKEIGEKLLVNT